MSGRGRGRGRGRGYAPPTGAKLFLMRSAEECGLDSRNLRSLQDITRPALFPPIELHSSGDQRRLFEERAVEQAKAEAAASAQGGGAPVAVKSEDGAGSSAPPKMKFVRRDSKTRYLIEKGRELHQRIQSSVFYVRPTKEVPDVVRYSDRRRPPASGDASFVLSHCLGGRKRTRAGLFVPEELVKGQRRRAPAAGTASGADALSLEEIAARLRRDRSASVAEDAGKPEGGEQDEEEDHDDGEDSEGADYVANYYESEGEESDDAGDGEPTF